MTTNYYPYSYKSHPKDLKYPWIYATPSEKERDIRWRALKAAMKKSNFDCLIVGGYALFLNGRLHLYYISNYLPFAGRGTYAVFPLEGEPQLGVEYTLGPQFLHVASETSWIKEIVGSFDPAQDIINKVKQLKLENGKLGIVGYKTGIFPGPIYEALRQSFPGAILEDATTLVHDVMNEISRTSEEELRLLKMGCEVMDQSFDAVARALKPGVKECELWAAAEHAILKNGGWYPHFMLVTSGPKPIFLRAPPSQTVLNRGDVVIFEINVICGGVSPQICYALSMGKPDKEIEKMFDFCKELYDFALAELEKKRTFMDVEVALVDRIHGAGFDPLTPQIHVYNMSSVMPMGSLPQPGDYFTVHPNICNLGYSMSAKFGDPVLMTKEGKIQRLQKTPAKLNIV